MSSLLGVGLAQQAVSQGRSAIVITEADSGKEVLIERSQQLLIRLRSQLGTGFTWSAEPEIAPPLKLVEKRLEAGSRAAPGAPEFQIFLLVPTGPGTGTVRLVYRQPWLREQPPARIFQLRAVVR
jgi:predicted secreted protein